MFTCTGLSPSMVQFSKRFHFTYIFNIEVLQPHICRNKYGLGSSLFDRLYLGNHYCFLFLRLLRCFSSPGSPPASRISQLHWDGFPHSEIIGSTVICTSPKLIAAYRVLHRLWEPRHPPYALIIFFRRFLNLSACQRTFSSSVWRIVKNIGIEPISPRIWVALPLS